MCPAGLGTVGVEGEPAGGHREIRGVQGLVLGVQGGAERLEGAVEDGRVHGVRAPVGGQRAACGESGDDLGPASPQLLDPLEGGAVLQTGAAQRGVVVGDRGGGGAAGAYGVERFGAGGGGGGAEGGPCGLGPLVVGAGPGEQAQRAGLGGPGYQDKLQRGGVAPLGHDGEPAERDVLQGRVAREVRAGAASAASRTRAAGSTGLPPTWWSVRYGNSARSTGADQWTVCGERRGRTVPQHRVAAVRGPAAGGLLVPVPGALPGVGGQVGQGPGGAVDAGPVDPVTGGVEAAQFTEHGGAAGLFPAERGHRDAVPGGRQPFGDGVREHRVR